MSQNLKMKFAIEIKMTADVEIKNITPATVIRDLAQPAKPKDLVLEDKFLSASFRISGNSEL